MRYIIIIVLILGGLVWITNQAFLYSSDTTHPYLTEEMVKFYNYYYDPDIPLDSEHLRQMKEGSTHEDFGDRSVWYHFYDPIYNKGSGSLTAKQWAQSPEKQASTLGGDHSWQTAIAEYNAGYKQKAFYSLGHTLHLIEDMAVPAHTRNDMHYYGDPLEKWAGSLPQNSAFYNIAQPLIDKGIKPKIFSNLDTYFDEVANFSNSNFFSKESVDDTIDVKTGQVLSKARYSGPRIVKEGWENGQKYGYGKVPGNSKLIRLVKIGKNEQGEKKYFITRDIPYEDSPEIHADYFSILSKEAVIHGAGVIKLFFDSVIEPEREIIEPEQKLSWFQKISNTIVGAAKFVYSVVDGIIHTSPSTFKSVVEESMPPAEYLTTLEPNLIEEMIRNNSEDAVEETELVEEPVIPESTIEESYEVKPSKLPEKENIFVVKRVIDGDTIVLENGQEVRYIGIDAPEFPNGCFAQEATSENKELLEGKKVRLEKDVSETDSYGRLLRYVYLDDLFINDYLIRNGYAYDFAYGSDTKYEEQFADAEEEAKENGKGLWGDVCHPLVGGIEEQEENGPQIVQGPKTGGSGGVSPKIAQETQNQSQSQESSGQQEEQFEQQQQQEEQEGEDQASGGEPQGEDQGSEQGGEQGESEEEQGGQEQQEIEYGDVVINEIAWMGTEANYADEWIELYNNASQSIDLIDWTLEAVDGTPSISFTASISANGYFLLERTDDQTIANIAADQFYTGALGNEGENLVLKDNNGNIIDQVDCSEGWYVGDNEEKRTMERVSFLVEGSASSSWQTYSGSGSDALDVEDNPIFGTPKAENSITDSESEEGEEDEEDEEGESDEDEESEYYTVISNHIVQDTIWTLENSPYIVYDNTSNSYELLEVAEDITLTIEPGVIVKFVNPGLKVFGTIKAEGTNDNPIVFTDYNDKEYAGEIFGNPDNPQPGAWSGIWITESSTDSVLDNVVIRYAGSRKRPFDSGFTYSSRAVGAAVRVEDTSIILKNSIIEYNFFKGLWLINSSDTIVENSTFQNHLNHDNSHTTLNKSMELRNIAIYIDSSGPQIRDSTFQNNLTGIYIINNSQPVIEDNNFSNNSRPVWVQSSYPQFSGNQIESNQWDGIVIKGLKLDQDYALGGGSVFINYEEIPSWSIVVPEGYTLTIEPGTIIKSVAGTSGLTIEGTLIAEGTVGEPIIFTSLYDDEYGGDTNGDGGATTAGAGWWGQIIFTPTSTDSILDYVVIRYGGTKWGQSYNHRPDYVLDIDSSDITLAHAIVENNTSGCRLEHSNSYIVDTSFRNHQYEKPNDFDFKSTGLRLVSSNANIDLSTFLNNKLGIYIDPVSIPTLLNPFFADNERDIEDMRPEEEEEGA